MHRGVLPVLSRQPQRPNLARGWRDEVTADLGSTSTSYSNEFYDADNVYRNSAEEGLYISDGTLAVKRCNSCNEWRRQLSRNYNPYSADYHDSSPASLNPVMLLLRNAERAQAAEAKKALRSSWREASGRGDGSDYLTELGRSQMYNINVDHGVWGPACKCPRIPHNVRPGCAPALG